MRYSPDHGAKTIYPHKLNKWSSSKFLENMKTARVNNSRSVVKKCRDTSPNLVYATNDKSLCQKLDRSYKYHVACKIIFKEKHKILSVIRNISYVNSSKKLILYSSEFHDILLISIYQFHNTGHL